jgi:DNA-binding MarR family transcriptional regulator
VSPTRRDPDSPAASADSPAASAAPVRPALEMEADLRFRLGRAHRLVRASWETAIEDLGLRAAQAGVLRAIAAQPGTGIRELARRLATDPMNAKRIADGLERDGLVVSGSNPDDARRRVMAATPEGADLARELDLRAAAWDRATRERLGHDDAQELQRLLARVEAGLGKGGDAGGGPHG